MNRGIYCELRVSTGTMSMGLWRTGVLRFTLGVQRSRGGISAGWTRGCVCERYYFWVIVSFKILITTIHRDTPGSLCCGMDAEEDLMTAWPCSFPGRWGAAPPCCPLSPVGHRSGGQWAVGRWAEYRRPERGRTVSGGLLQVGGRTGRPAWPAAARSWPRPSACPAQEWAPRHSPPPESRWSYATGLSWSQSSSGPAVPWRSSCMPFSERTKYQDHFKSSPTFYYSQTNWAQLLMRQFKERGSNLLAQQLCTKDTLRMLGLQPTCMSEIIQSAASPSQSICSTGRHCS